MNLYPYLRKTAYVASFTSPLRVVEHLDQPVVCEGGVQCAEHDVLVCSKKHVP